MPNQVKYDRILDALQELLENQKMQTISVSEIAQTAGIGKGSIYYYFPSKDAILEALVERNYEKPLRTAKALFSRRAETPPQNLSSPRTAQAPGHRRRRSSIRNISITSSPSSSRSWQRSSARGSPRERFTSRIPLPWQRSC